MKHRLKAIVLSIGIACALAPSMGWASFEEGVQAHQAKNYTAAFNFSVEQHFTGNTR